MPTAQQWKNSGLIPTSGLAAWNMYEAGVSGDNAIYDYSGNGRHLISAALNAPVLQAGTAPNNQVSWYFDGTDTVPLQHVGAITPKHIFLLGSYQDAAFDLNRGLLTDLLGVDVLVSNSSGSNFYDSAYGGSYEYQKSGSVYAESAAAAPMNGAFALLEAKIPAGLAMDGLQIGRQKAVAGRIWKGRFAEMLVFTSVLSREDVRRVRLYFNLKFAQHLVGLPFHFPSDDFMPVRRRRFKAEPRDFSKTTDSYEFEDGGKTFNEVSSDPPRRWQYEYKLLNNDAPTDPPLTVIFDEFSEQARLINPFLFKDKYGVVWDNVRIEKYDRDHDKHKPWKQEINFRLVGYQSTGVLEAESENDSTPPTAPTGLTATAQSDTEILLEWGESTDPDEADATPPSVPSGFSATAESDTEILLEWTASEDPLPGVPSAPEGLGADIGTGGEVTITWTPSVD